MYKHARTRTKALTSTGLHARTLARTHTLNDYKITHTLTN